MADSDIVCSGLSATSGVGQVVLAWAVSDPNQAGLPYLALDAVEVWSAATNNRAGATKVGEGTTFAIHAGVPEGETRYYWIRPRTQSGVFGDWLPLNSAAGVEGISATATKIVAGRVEGSEIVGGLIKTSDASPKIEIDSDPVQFRLFDEAGNLSLVLGPAGTLGDCLVYAESYGNSPAGIFRSLNGAAFFARSEKSIGISALTNVGLAAVTGAGLTSGYAFFSSKGGYGPFTGAHDGLLAKDSAAVPGDVLVDLRVVSRGDISNTLTEVGLSTHAAQRGVLGVLAGRRAIDAEDEFAAGMVADASRFDRAIINALGEGQINVCSAGGAIEMGDLLISSPIAGKAMRQPDDIVRSTTIARAREPAIFDEAGLAQVACIYLAG